MQKEVRIWEFVFEKVLKEGERDALAVNFIANITGHQAAVNVARFSPSGFCFFQLLYNSFCLISVYFQYLTCEQRLLILWFARNEEEGVSV